MYKYTHLITADQVIQEYTANGTSTRDGGRTYNSSAFASTYSGEGPNAGLPGDLVEFGESSSFTCAAGTRGNSISTIEGSVIYSSSEIRVTDTLGNTQLNEDAWASTTTVYAVGSSTGVDTVTATFPSTTQTTYSTTFHQDSDTTISGTASGKTTGTGQNSYTYTAVTLVPVFAIPNAAKVERYYVGRDGLPPLRAVASGFAFDATGSTSAKSFSTGSYAFVADKYSGTTADLFAGESYTYLTLAKLSASEYSANFTAKRKRPSANIYKHAGSTGASISFDSVVQNSAQFLTSVGSMLVAPRIFKTALITSDSSSTTTFVWRYTAGGWSLAYTTKNSAASSTGYAGFTISGSPSFTDENAVTVIGASSNILGPLIPLSYEGLNIISSTRGSSTGGNSAFYSFACSSSGSSSASAWSTSSSDTVSFGSTYAPSRLTGYVNLPACDISTESTYFNTFYEDEGSFSPTIPDISKNAKWNEAGRQDPVAVLE